MDAIWILLIGSTITFSGRPIEKQEWKIFNSAEELATYVPNIKSRNYTVWRGAPGKLTAVIQTVQIPETRCKSIEPKSTARRCILKEGHEGDHYPHDHDPIDACILGW